LSASSTSTASTAKAASPGFAQRLDVSSVDGEDVAGADGNPGLAAQFDLAAAGHAVEDLDTGMGVVGFDRTGGELDAKDAEDLAAGQLHGGLGFDNQPAGDQ
jgi:hypothetical protein